MTFTVEPLSGHVNITRMVTWLNRIPLEEWPQQSKTELKPAMVTDRKFGILFGFYGNEIIAQMQRFNPASCYNYMLSCVMPGHFIEPHKDEQAPDWIYRVHVPLITNPKAVTIMDDGEHHMEVGKAYKMNTRATHSVENRGENPRVHFMFDVRA